MLGGVRDQLGDGVVGRDLDTLGELVLHTDVEVDRDGRAAGEGLQRGAEPALGQDRRVDPTRYLPELVEGGGQALHDLCELGANIGDGGWQRGLRGSDVERERDEPLRSSTLIT
jgi:hypothetical protein